jgi:hypothetical protein
MKNTVLLSMLSTPTGNTNERQYSPVEEKPKEYLWLIQTTSFLFRFLFRADHHQVVRLSVAANDPST